MREKRILNLGILNFSYLMGMVLVIVSLWGDKLYTQQVAEIQNTDLISIDLECLEEEVTHYQKHIDIQ